jgi:WD40 repeat protein
MLRRFVFLVALVVLVLPLIAPGQPPAAQGRKGQADGKTAHLDRYGDPLPPGAIARLGSIRFRAHDAVHTLVVTPNGRLLAVGDGSGFTVWDALTGKQLYRLPYPHNRCVAFSADSKHLATGGEKAICLWDAVTGKQLRCLQLEPCPPEIFSTICSINFSPDGKLLASGHIDKAIRLWDTASGKLIRLYPGHTDLVDMVVFSLDGKTLISSSQDGRVCFWEVASGTLLRRVGGPILCLSPDGRLLATTDNGARSPLAKDVQEPGRTVRIHHMATGRELARFAGPSPRFISGAFSPNGKLLALSRSSSEYYIEIDSIHLIEVATGRLVRVLREHPNGCSALTFSPDGRYLISAGGNSIRWWDIATGQRVRQFTGHENLVQSVAFAPDGKTLGSGSFDGKVRLWEPQTGRQVRVLAGHTKYVWSVAFSPDGKIAASTSYDRTLRLWDVISGKERLRLRAEHQFQHPVFTPDGKRLVTFNTGGFIQIWDPVSGREIRRVGKFGKHKPYGVNAFVHAPQGSLVALTAGNEIQLWDLATGMEVRKLKDVPKLKGYTCWVVALALSPDGKQLASVNNEGTVRLWDVATGKGLLMPKSEHEWGSSTVAFSPSGKLLATAQDCTVLLWDAATGKEVLSLQGHSGSVNTIAFSPDGRFLASGSDDTTILVWDLQECAALRWRK